MRGGQAVSVTLLRSLLAVGGVVARPPAHAVIWAFSACGLTLLAVIVSRLKYATPTAITLIKAPKAYFSFFEQDVV